MPHNIYDLSDLQKFSDDLLSISQDSTGFPTCRLGCDLSPLLSSPDTSC